MLAMHMRDSLLTPAVAATFLVTAGATLVYAGQRVRLKFDPAKVPLMGVLGAFVFAAQMINFPVLPGTSGHLIGGLLLALVLGPHSALLVMGSILIVQCLIFQDGGLLALGANIVNMGVMQCYVGCGLYRLMAGKSADPRRCYAAILLAALISVAAGAALVVVEVRVSNLLAVPFSEFLLLMVAIHLLIGLVEAMITFGVVAYLVKVRPQLMEVGAGFAGHTGRLSARTVAGSFLVVALLMGGLLSLYKSELPDGLESLTERESARRPMVAANPSKTMQQVEELHTHLSPLPGYKSIGSWSSASGVIGTVVALGGIWMLAKTLKNRPRGSEHHGAG